MRQFGKHARHVSRPRWLAAGAVGACLLGLSSAALTSASAGTATPPVAAPATGAPDSMASNTLTPAMAKALDVPAGTTGCPVPTSLLQMQCQVLVEHGKKRAGSTTLTPRSAAVKVATTTITNSLGPADLRTAYGLTSASANDGAGETVAIVDAYGDPTITSDFDAYRANWGMTACDNCLSVFNENGQTSPLPAATDEGWEDETALDVEMVTAICPLCHIDLFQASTANLPDLGAAEKSAAKVSKFISNSWSGGDYPGDSVYDSQYFNDPGAALVFASGDYGLGATYPGSSGLVTSVGGTYIDTDGTESVWNGQNTGAGTGTAAGCSAAEGKPSWQADTGCTNRTQNDVSAVADAPYGIDEYSSSGDCGYDGAFSGENGDCASAGTSVATPIITAIYALANPSGPTSNTYPVSYLYQHAGDSSDLNLIASGQVGTCESTRRYLCDAGSSLSNGYNGPAGLGTPQGVGAFQNSASGNIVSIDNPGSYDLEAGSRVTLPAIRAYDSESGAKLTYSQSGLPSTLSINSATGVISGTLPASAVNDKVTVTVTDGTASSSVSFNFVGVKAMSSSYHAGVGKVTLVHVANTCMNDPHNDTAVDSPVATYPCQVSSSQDWSYLMPANPGQAGQISIHGKCASVLGGKNKAGYYVVGLVNCSTTSSAQQWDLTGYDGEIVNPGRGECLTDPGSTKTANTQFDIQPCTGIAGQTLVVPASPVTSGIASKCLADSSGAVITTSCTGAAAQQVTLGLDGSLQFNGQCIYNAASNPNDGTAIRAMKCSNTNYSEEWGISAYGEIESLTTEKCLAVTGNSSSNGAKLELNDCTGQPGEVWAVS